MRNILYSVFCILYSVPAPPHLQVGLLQYPQGEDNISVLEQWRSEIEKQSWLNEDMYNELITLNNNAGSATLWFAELDV